MVVIPREGGKAAIEMLLKPGKSDRVHTQTKLAAIIDTVVAGGVSPTHALAGVGVSPAELLSPHTRVSVQQVLIACGNAIRLSQDPSFGVFGPRGLDARIFLRHVRVCNSQQRGLSKYHELL